MDTVKLNYKEFGQGQPLIILHGLFGTLDNWTTIGKFLGENGFHVFLLDQRNHGRSPHSSNWDYHHMAADLKTFIEDHKIIAPIILGHSMGGKTVMKFGVTHAHIAKKIIVADIAPKYYPPHHQEILEGLNSVNIDTLENRTDADQRMSSIINDFGIRQFLLKNLQRTPTGFAWKMNFDLIAKEIENVGEPLAASETCDTLTLFVRGGSSHYILDEDREILKHHFPNSSLTTIDGAGHWLHAEKPKEFTKVILDFINA